MTPDVLITFVFLFNMGLYNFESNSNRNFMWPSPSPSYHSTHALKEMITNKIDEFTKQLRLFYHEWLYFIIFLCRNSIFSSQFFPLTVPLSPSTKVSFIFAILFFFLLFSTPFSWSSYTLTLCYRRNILPVFLVYIRGDVSMCVWGGRWNRTTPRYN